MYTRLIHPPKMGSFFLFGPRGTGKSSWVKKTFPQADYIDFLDSEIYIDLLASPKRLSRYANFRKGGRIILDEVQKIPQILDEVHRLIETEKIDFILTGSNAKKLKRSGANLLAGRAENFLMYPFTAQELGSDFDLKRSLKYGMLPGVFSKTDPQKFLKAYVQTYLKEEIIQEGLTRSLPAFSRFLESTSFSQGSVLSVSAIAEDCSVPRKSVENYFQILEDLLLCNRVPSFTRRAKRRMVSHPKFYFFDAGVYRSLRPQGPLDHPEETEGIALETLVFQELRALNSYLDLGYEIHYWRTGTQLEVDFVLYGEKGIRAFEVKRSDRIRSSDFKGLHAFLEDYPESRAYFLYGGTKKFKEGKITVLPLQDFFKNSPDFLGI